MEANSPDSPLPPTTPYREPPPAPPPSSACASRALFTAATLVAGAFAMIVSLTSFHTASHRGRCATVYAQAVPVAPERHLDSAVHDLARRRRRPLFLAPGLDHRAFAPAIAPGTLDGELPETVRALDAYAAPHGLWFHEADGVLRLERAAGEAELDCEATLDACATRLQRLAAVHVLYPPSVAESPAVLHLRRGVPAAAGTRDALVAQGFEVDLTDRTLYVTRPERAAPARRAEPLDIQTYDGRVSAISRRTLEHLLEYQATLMRGTRIVPEVRDGRTVGVRLLTAPAGGVLARLGLRAGDVLERVNGFDIASPDRCLEAYARLRNTDRISLALRRAGRPTTLVWIIT